MRGEGQNPTIPFDLENISRFPVIAVNRMHFKAASIRYDRIFDIAPVVVATDPSADKRVSLGAFLLETRFRHTV